MKNRTVVLTNGHYIEIFEIFEIFEILNVYSFRTRITLAKIQRRKYRSEEKKKERVAGRTTNLVCAPNSYSHEYKNLLLTHSNAQAHTSVKFIILT